MGTTPSTWAEDILQMWRGPGEENVTIAVAGLGAQRVQFTPTGMVNPNHRHKDLPDSLEFVRNGVRMVFAPASRST